MEQQAYPPDLLVHLSKYAPTRTVTPLENFVTEAFAYLLRACASVRDTFLANFCGVKSGAYECTISTQRSFPDGSRPDLFISAGEHRIYIENKVWSDLNQYDVEAGGTIDQIAKYVGAIPESELPVSQVKLITSRPVFGLAGCRREPLVFSPDRDHKRWADVYRMLREDVQPSSTITAFLVDSFCTLLEEHDMAPFEGVGKNLKDIAESYTDISAAARKLQGRLLGRFTSLLDEIFKASGISPGHHSSSAKDPSVAASFNHGRGRFWLVVYFGVERFLLLKLAVYRDSYKGLDPSEIEGLKQNSGYAIDEWKQLCKTLPLPEASGAEAAREQVRCGAEFLKAELAAWERLLASEH